jgi:hypothetical protein
MESSMVVRMYQGDASEVVGVESGGRLYGWLCVCRRISSSLVWRILRSTGFMVDWDLGFDIAPFVVGLSLSLVGYSSNLGVE